MEGCHFIWISLGSFPVSEGLKLVWKTAAKEHVFGMTLGVLLLCKLVHSKMRHTWKNVTSTRVSEEALGSFPVSQSCETSGKLPATMNMKQPLQCDLQRCMQL